MSASPGIQPSAAPPPSPSQAYLANITDATPDNYCNDSDPALRTAWERFLQYDAASARHKTHSTAIRMRVILLGLMTSVLAVVLTYKDTIGIIGALDSIIRLLLILTPLTTAGLMAYAMQFSPSLSWIAYRVGAELVRRQIYLYRMNAAPYFGKTIEEQRTTLLQQVNDADMQVAQIGTPDPYLQTPPPNLPKVVATKTNAPSDNGFARMSVEEYIAYRVIPQHAWYIKRTYNDYEMLKRTRIIILVLTAAGSLFPALPALGVQNPETLVAISGAVGVSASLILDLLGYGRTYGIYHLTADRIGIAVSDWHIKTPEEKASGDAQAAFVKRLEDIFQQERDMWKQQAIQSQTASEQAIMRNMNQGAANAFGKTDDDKNNFSGALTAAASALLDSADTAPLTTAAQGDGTADADGADAQSAANDSVPSANGAGDPAHADAAPAADAAKS